MTTDVGFVRENGLEKVVLAPKVIFQDLTIGPRIGYVEEIRTKLGLNWNGRKEIGRCVLREEPVPYNAVFDPKNELLSPENGYFWDNYSADSAC